MDSKRYCIFLRGVNVGGNATVSMDLLKKSLGENNFRDVRTYINSGNIIVSTTENKMSLSDNFNRIMKARFGFTAGLIIKTREELQSILDQDPFDKENETGFSQRMVVMLSEQADSEKFLLIKGDSTITENCYLLGDVLYIYYDHGAGRSKFTNNYIERKLKLTATSRNWNTMLKIAGMMQPE